MAPNAAVEYFRGKVDLGKRATLIVDERMNAYVVAGHGIASLQKRQFHQDSKTDHVSPGFADQLDSGCCRATGREHVVDDDHAICRGQRTLVRPSQE